MWICLAQSKIVVRSFASRFLRFHHISLWDLCKLYPGPYQPVLFDYTNYPSPPSARTLLVTKVSCVPWHVGVWVHPGAKHPITKPLHALLSYTISCLLLSHPGILPLSIIHLLRGPPNPLHTNEFTLFTILISSCSHLGLLLFYKHQPVILFLILSVLLTPFIALRLSITTALNLDLFLLPYHSFASISSHSLLCFHTSSSPYLYHSPHIPGISTHAPIPFALLGPLHRTPFHPHTT